VGHLKNTNHYLQNTNSVIHIHITNPTSHLHVTNSMKHVQRLRVWVRGNLNNTNSMIHVHITNPMSHLRITNSVNHQTISNPMSLQQCVLAAHTLIDVSKYHWLNKPSPFHEPNESSTVCLLAVSQIQWCALHLNITNSMSRRHSTNPMSPLQCVYLKYQKLNNDAFGYHKLSELLKHHEPNVSSASHELNAQCI